MKHKPHPWVHYFVCVGIVATFTLPGIGSTTSYTRTETVLAHEIEKVETLPEIKIIEVPKRAKQEWIEHLYNEAERYGADPEKMIATIGCETGHTWDADIQSGYHFADGTRERSFGLSQIFLPAHPQVSYDEATDPYYAITFMAQHFGENNGKIWTCFRNLFGNSSATI